MEDMQKIVELYKKLMTYAKRLSLFIRTKECEVDPESVPSEYSYVFLRVEHGGKYTIWSHDKSDRGNVLEDVTGKEWAKQFKEIGNYVASTVYVPMFDFSHEGIWSRRFASSPVDVVGAGSVLEGLTKLDLINVLVEMDDESMSATVGISEGNVKNLQRKTEYDIWNSLVDDDPYQDEVGTTDEMRALLHEHGYTSEVVKAKWIYGR